MQKTLALTIVSVLLLAGCTGVTEELIDELVETVVPGCNDPAAFNYDENASNAEACLTEAILTSALKDLLVDTPGPDESVGMIEVVDSTEDGMEMTMTTTMVISPASGMHVGMSVDSGMISFENHWWAFPNGDGTTIYVDYNGEKFAMQSALGFTDTLLQMSAEDDDSSDDDNDVGLDMSMYDWETADFTHELSMVGTEVYHQFTTDLILEGETHAIEILVDASLVIRTINVDIAETETSGQITFLTASEIAADLSIDSSEYSATEALPFSLGESDSFDLMVHEESNDEMTMIWECQYFTNESMPTEYGNWDSLDDSMCGEVVDSTIVIDETYSGELGMPQAFNMIEDEEEILISISNEMIISMIMSDYSVETGDSTGMWCEEEGGTYDSTADTCSLTFAEITAYDDMYMEIITEEGEYELLHYQYDAATTSGILALAMYGYTCHDGEVIDADWVNDGMDDCADGSDEFDDGGGEEWTFICGNGDEIPFSWVNDGMDDCADGADEQQYDTDGNPTNWYDCMDGSQVWISEVNDGVEDCPDGTDEYYEDDGGFDHYFDYIWVCEPFIESTAWTAGGMDAWDGYTLDSSMCETLVEWDMTMTDTEATIPMSWYMYFEDDIVGHMELVEDTTEMATYLYVTVDDWSVATGDSAGDWCDGQYDSTEDTCEMEVGELLDADDSMIEFFDNWEGDNIHILYEYDTATGFGLFAFPEEVFLCYSGEIEWVYADAFDDGWEDCADGSDEPEYEGDGIETTLWYDGADLYWALEYDNDDEFAYVVVELFDQMTGDSLMSSEFTSDYVMVTAAEAGFTDGECYYAKATSYDIDDMYLTMSEEWFCTGDEPWDDETEDMIVTADGLIAFEGDLSDYHAVLAICSEEYDDDTDESTTVCENSTVPATALADAMADGGANGIFFFDEDDSGTLSIGDYFTVSEDVDAEWNTLRLYSESADAYSDENPTLPGFTGLIAVLGLLGALLVRKNE
ncbi:MAG: low-density lipoprotein receptor class A repeat-containing protein [archaeon]|nr:low-density lipoprotein receptor class A repeat-containing protein [archaeon]